MQVLKFGGSSVANATNICKVENIVLAAAQHGRVILISSAIKGCTDSLIRIGAKAAAGDRSYLDDMDALLRQHLTLISELLPQDAREGAEAECRETFAQIAQVAVEDGTSDRIQTFGELLSTKVIARRLAVSGKKVLWMDSRELVKKGDLQETYSRIFAAVQANPDVEIFVAPGFIASDANGIATTLGRGGSDYSAAIYAAGSKADTLEIWTDVPGIMSSNPKLVPSAHTIPHISYQAALDMAQYGAKVLYAPTVKPAMDSGIAISILNTFAPGAIGTVIEANPPRSKFDLLGLANMPDPEVEGNDRVSLVGADTFNTEEASKTVVEVLDASGINHSNLKTENKNIFVSVPSNMVRDTMLALHRAFFEARQISYIDLYIAGFGAVGKCLVELLQENRKRIEERKGVVIRVVGLSNRRKFIIDKEGIDLSRAATLLAGGASASSDAFLEAIDGDYLRRSVFVDCTTSDTIGSHYIDLFKKGIKVVSCNRKAFAVPFEQYKAMRKAARENGVSLRYGTTVGAALPVLESISSSANSSDEIISIKAAVSCTLNYVITNYDGEKTDPLATLLRRAQDDGLTEMDPRQDLGGRDALRKLLILAREAGVPLEESDVKVTPFLGPEFFECSLDEFYRKLREYEPEFIAREHDLESRGMHQRFVASIERDPASKLGYRAEIKIREVDRTSPFFRLRGTENVISIKSKYITSDLVIRGDGEGARLAASGVINDILMR